VDNDTDHTVVGQMSRNLPWNAGTPDSLTITSGKFLVRSLQFQQLGDYSVDTDISASDEARDYGDPNILYQGPYALRVTGSQVIDLGQQTLQVGEYNAMSLILHKGKSTDDLGDDADMVGRSVRVSGYVWYGDNGESFTFEIDLRTEILITGNFSVTAGGNPQFVVEFDVGNWFRFGDSWFNPNDPDNLPFIYRNIQRNVRGGQDFNNNGRIGD
jgi:hypothetical protein